MGRHKSHQFTPNHTPVDQGRTVGVELEVSGLGERREGSPRARELLEALGIVEWAMQQGEGSDDEGEISQQWEWVMDQVEEEEERLEQFQPLKDLSTSLGETFTEDGSVEEDSLRMGGELVSQPMTLGGLDAFCSRVCTRLERAGASCNASTGLHVHVDAAGLVEGKELTAEGKSFLRLFQRVQSLLWGMVDREKVDYCRPLPRNWTPSWTGDRRRDLNVLEAWWDHGTVEFRLHEGTVDPRVVRNWAALCRGLVELGMDCPSRMWMALAPEDCLLLASPDGECREWVRGMLEGAGEKAAAWEEERAREEQRRASVLRAREEQRRAEGRRAREALERERHQRRLEEVRPLVESGRADEAYQAGGLPGLAMLLEEEGRRPGVEAIAAIRRLMRGE